MFVAFAPEEAERLARELERLAWVRKLTPTNPHERLRAEAQGARFVVWGSGKLSYQGPHARATLEEVVRGAGIEDAVPHTAVGSDEAGKGEWLGPLVVAAVAVAPEQHLALRLDGVRDSKQLKGEVRQRMADAVRARALASEVVAVMPRRFNELWDDMHARGQTLNDLLWWAHRKALEPVLAAVQRDAAAQGGAGGAGNVGNAGNAGGVAVAGVEVRVVLDEFDQTRRAARMFEGILPPGAEVQQMPRAEDRSIAVAAASVLARAARDAAVARLVERHGLDPERLTPEEARGHPEARQFAKVAYLGQGGTRAPPPA